MLPCPPFSRLEASGRIIPRPANGPAAQQATVFPCMAGRQGFARLPAMPCPGHALARTGKGMSMTVPARLCFVTAGCGQHGSGLPTFHFSTGPFHSQCMATADQIISPAKTANLHSLALAMHSLAGPWPLHGIWEAHGRPWCGHRESLTRHQQGHGAATAELWYSHGIAAELLWNDH